MILYTCLLHFYCNTVTTRSSVTITVATIILILADTTASISVTGGRSHPHVCWLIVSVLHLASTSLSIKSAASCPLHWRIKDPICLPQEIPAKGGQTPLAIPCHPLILSKHPAV